MSGEGRMQVEIDEPRAGKEDATQVRIWHLTRRLHARDDERAGQRRAIAEQIRDGNAQEVDPLDDEDGGCEGEPPFRGCDPLVRAEVTHWYTPALEGAHEELHGTRKRPRIRGVQIQSSPGCH